MKLTRTKDERIDDYKHSRQRIQEHIEVVKKVKRERAQLREADFEDEDAYYDHTN